MLRARHLEQVDRARGAGPTAGVEGGDVRPDVIRCESEPVPRGTPIKRDAVRAVGVQLSELPLNVQ